MKKKNIALWIVLSIITCGIAALIWIVQMTDDSNRLLEDEQATSGGMVILLTIITCGIYGIYWNYKMGKKVYEIQLKNNALATDNSILYLVLALIGFSIVNYCLIQSELNKFLPGEEA